MPSPTEIFIGTLSQTPPLSAALQKNLQRLRTDLDSILRALGSAKTLADDLDKLDDTLTLVSRLLTVVSVIPEVGQAASALKNSINLLSQQVGPARKAADKLEATVKPLREALEKLGPVLDEAIRVTGQINSASQAFLDKFTAVVSCVNSLPDGEYKQKAQQYLDQFSSDMQPVVAQLNNALSTANDAVNTFYSALQTIKAALDPLAAIASAVEQVLSVLNPLIGPLQELEHALKTIQILIPIPYPHMVTLYDVFKDLGAFIDLAMKPIQDLVNQVLRALHITLPSIPGLSDLLQIKIDIPAIPDFPALMLAITNPFHALELAIASFSLKCPPGRGDTVPLWTRPRG